MSQTVSHGLYIVATPIGNLEDITLRALNIFKKADAVVCEDTRVTQNLLGHFGIAKKLYTYHEHNAEAMRPKLLALLESGQTLALVSDAGTPLISDPGYKLVRAVASTGIPVIPIPGPSALLAGLIVSGLASDRFFFQGFLPVQAGKKKKILEGLRALDATLIFYETPKKFQKTAQVILEILGDREAAVGRELTKLFEETIRGKISTLMAYYEDTSKLKGEMVFIVDGNRIPETLDEDALDHLIGGYLKTHSVKDTVEIILGVYPDLQRKKVYDRALALKKI